MKCYYETLGIPQTANAQEITKAYKRKALKAHPDKNILNPEEATRMFTEIQTAYQILSNEHDRKWYDLHRAEILRGPLDLSSKGISKDFMSVEQVLTFTIKLKSTNDFYTCVREFYIKIDLEEQLALEIDPWATQTNIDFCSFGYEDTSEHDLQLFYIRFLGFQTVKSFSWFDVCEPLNEPDRYLRRQAEKKNKKARDNARKSFNDAVVGLTASVRRNDPRIQRQLENAERVAKEKEEKLKNERIQMRKDLFNLGQEYVEPSWSRVSVEFSDDEFECVVCDMVFSTAARLKKHESSRAHCLQLEILREEMADVIEDAVVSDDIEDIADEIQSLEIKSEEDQLFNCEVCSKSFQTNAQLNQHLQSKKHRAEVKAQAKQSSSDIPKAEEIPAPPKPKKRKEKKPPTGHVCRSCKTAFPSKTKLFQHLESTGHAVFK